MKLYVVMMEIKRETKHTNPNRHVRKITSAAQPSRIPKIKQRLRIESTHEPIDSDHAQVKKRHAQQLVVQSRLAEVAQYRVEREVADAVQNTEQRFTQRRARRR